MSYSDELSVKLTAKDEMSRALKEARKQLDETHRAMIQARKDYQDTGSPEALRQLRDLEKQAEQTRKAIKAGGEAAKRARKDYDDFVNGTGKYATAMDRFRRSVEKHATTIRNTGLVVAGALALFSKSALQEFSKVEDATSALTATFGAQGEQLAQWAKTSGDAFNLSQAEALAAAQSFAIFGESAGLAGQDLVAFSSGLAERAADLASYFGGSTADAINAIGSALRGEAEPARRYGVLLDEASLKAKALELGIYGGTGALTQQAKILAAHAVVMDQTSRAQGDVARTADSTANAIKDASQQWADFQASMGEFVAKVAGPGLRTLSGMLGYARGLPEPVQATALAVGALSAAAMIATPRLLAMNTALQGIGLSLGALGPFVAILAGGAVATAKAYDAGEKLNTGQKNLTETMTENTGLLGFMAIGFSNLRSVIDRVRGVTDDATDAIDDNAQATKDAAQEASYAAYRFRALAEQHRAGATAADVQTAAEKRLAGALGRAERLLARRDAMRSYRQAMKDFIADPSAEAGDAVSRSMLGVAQTYKDPEKRAKFVKRSYKDIEAAVKGSNLPASIKAKVTSPLHDAYLEAQKLLGTLQAIAIQNANPYTRNPGAQAALGFASGGVVYGPGTGTSDSIPARLSRGEFVVREAAARVIGYDTLHRINQADRVPVLPPIVNAPTIALPATQPGRDAPLVGHLEVHASQQVDVDLALMRLHRQQQRDQRTRMAGTR